MAKPKEKQTKGGVFVVKHPKGCTHKGKRCYNGDVVKLADGEHIPSYFARVPDAETVDGAVEGAQAAAKAETSGIKGKQGPGNRTPTGTSAKDAKGKPGDRQIPKSEIPNPLDQTGPAEK